MSEAPRLFTPAEAAAILHANPNTVARWANKGRLTAIRTPGGHRRYLISEVRALARKRRSRE